MITLNQLLKTFRTRTAIAQTLGVSHVAVSKWPMDGAIPAYREIQLCEMFPHLFKRPEDKELIPRLLAERGGVPRKSLPTYSGRLKLPTVPSTRKRKEPVSLP